jgi:hypothetical protein
MNNAALRVTATATDKDNAPLVPMIEDPNANVNIPYNPYDYTYSWTSSLDSESPLLTSDRCSRALGTFIEDATALALATEASSHPTGLLSLYAQPWVYAGGGLGNMDKCPLQTCLAGAGTRRDSLKFTNVCMVPACTTYDLAVEDSNSAVRRPYHHYSRPIALWVATGCGHVFVHFRVFGGPRARSENAGSK